MSTTRSILSSAAAAARVTAPHVADAVRNPLIRHGVLLVVAAGATSDARWLRRRQANQNDLFNESWDRVRKADQRALDAELDAIKQSSQHYDKLSDLRRAHHDEISKVRDEDGSSWEYWSGLAESRGRALDLLHGDLADARARADELARRTEILEANREEADDALGTHAELTAELALYEKDLATARETIAEMSQALQAADRPDTPAALLDGAVEQLRSFRRVTADSASDLTEVWALVSTAQDIVSDACSKLEDSAIPS